MTLRILFFLLTAAVSWAQTPDPAVSLADTQQRTLTSAKIGQRYELLVSLPAGYGKSGQSYPALYVPDGWHFALMTFIVPADGRGEPGIGVGWPAAFDRCARSAAWTACP